MSFGSAFKWTLWTNTHTHLDIAVLERQQLTALMKCALIDPLIIRFPSAYDSLSFVGFNIAIVVVYYDGVQ